MDVKGATEEAQTPGDRADDDHRTQPSRTPELALPEPSRGLTLDQPFCLIFEIEVAERATK